MSQVTAVKYLSPMEGELLRAQLAFAGIRAHLGNVEPLTWFWHFAGALLEEMGRVLTGAP